MKRVIALILALSFGVLLFAGCGQTPAATGVVKIGLGSVSSIAKSKDMTADATAVAQIDTVMAAVAFDGDGKVVDVIIDTAQAKVNYDRDMKVTSDKSAPVKTKIELGDEYGMGAVSTIGKNWDEQIAELEKWMVGKTVAEIKGLKLNDGVPDAAELTSLVTMGVEDYIAVVEEAANYTVDVEDAVSLGFGSVTNIAKSKDATADAPASAQANNVMTATAFDKDGKVVGTLIDNAQVTVAFDVDGKVTSNKTAPIKSKIELGNEYGMGAVSSIGKNWHEQIAELQKWMVGKTVAEITDLQVKARTTPIRPSPMCLN